MQDSAHIGYLQHHIAEGVTIHESTAHPGQSAGRASTRCSLLWAAFSTGSCGRRSGRLSGHGPKKYTAGPLHLLPRCHFLTLPIPPQDFSKEVTTLGETAFFLQRLGSSPSSISCIPTSGWTQIQTRAPCSPLRPPTFPPPHLTPTVWPQSRKG